MNHTAPAASARAIPGRALLAVFLIAATIGGVLLARSEASSTHQPTSVADGLPLDGGDMAGSGPLTTGSGGVLPDGVTPFDLTYDGVANLDPALLDALREAATDAAAAGIELYVVSGWRSPEYQDRLLSEAVVTYGSEEEAARWVATADTSSHVSGDAVDVGPYDAVDWMADHGVEYDLCQIYHNESWHYELRPGARDAGCPTRYADPTEDPRMRR
jgi:D-alanyl-D-alanine carboxypeptidase